MTNRLRFVAVSAAQPETALDWDGTGDVRSMLYWDNPFPIYGNGNNASGTTGGNGVSYLFKVYPQQITRDPSVAGDRYWTTFFWGNSDNDDSANPGELFSWDGGLPNTYYGAHPYPNPGLNATTSNWEISAYSSDELGASVVYGQWYTQLFRAWRVSSSVVNHEFYYDLDLWVSSGGTQGFVTKQVNDAGWANTNPPIPRITMGQASWLDVPSNEEGRIRLRSIQMYVSLLSPQNGVDEHANPGSTGSSNIWYRNINPTSSDVTDKSGAGHNGQWRGTPAATWTA